MQVWIVLTLKCYIDCRWLFFRKCDSFLNSPNLQKKNSKKTILRLKFKFPAIHFTVIGGKFKFQVQDSYFEYSLLGDWKIWKTHCTFWKKSTFTTNHDPALRQQRSSFAKRIYLKKFPSYMVIGTYMLINMYLKMFPTYTVIGGHSKTMWTRWGR